MTGDPCPTYCVSGQAGVIGDRYSDVLAQGTERRAQGKKVLSIRTLKDILLKILTINILTH